MSAKQQESTQRPPTPAELETVGTEIRDRLRAYRDAALKHQRVCTRASRKQAFDTSDALLIAIAKRLSEAGELAAKRERALDDRIESMLAAHMERDQELDAERARLDWLEEHYANIAWLVPNSDPEVCEVCETDEGVSMDAPAHGEGFTLRAAIDAARTAGGEG